MELELDVRLDPTLGCGQAHRWRKTESGCWQGVVRNDVVTLRQTETGFEYSGSNERELREYFRAEDDLDVLATNVNVKRIAKMVESVCDHYGTDLGERRAFPTPKQILDGRETICECRLGFREPRFIQLAEGVENGSIDLGSMMEMPYEKLVLALQDINGVGPKVADCVALFGFGKLEAFPVDVRIQKCVERMYGVSGNYRAVSEFGRGKFGAYAGYAQEFLYHSDFI